ncbi:MAG: MgtC/SapB family protein [Oscillospiraceae bacterium]|jgi:putative Mg2+ transporter-C (MgtC) family protein|nr:MgtC/SapB family protein [Oscillospiraceae bacterium]
MEMVKSLLREAWADEQFRLTVKTLLRLGMAALCGGIIGYEREHSHRPAGLRTHILVAVGSALVMCTASFIFAGENTDPTRMGAQVISGIGFLGAGTILREGFSVKGLTTAASLWAVSCIGLAVGSGFWGGALVATGVIYLTLNALKKVVFSRTTGRTLFVGVTEANYADKISTILKNCGAKLRTMEILLPEDSEGEKFSRETSVVLKLFVFIPSERELALIKENLIGLQGVNDFYVE